MEFDERIVTAKLCYRAIHHLSDLRHLVHNSFHIKSSNGREKEVVLNLLGLLRNIGLILSKQYWFWREKMFAIC